MKKLLLAACLLAALPGCSAPPAQELEAKLRQLLVYLAKAKAQALLATGLRQYEDGEYADAEASLQSALDHGLPPSDQVTAHKHLAFIHCVAERQAECRYEFRKALAADPKMDLDPAEAEHPQWGPVFQSARAAF
jgi:Tfp pilus assembly protein PilF